MWTDRLVEEGGRGAPTDRDTKFFLLVTTKSGEKKFTDNVPVMDAAGNVLVGADGKPLRRFVGPQDCEKGAQVTVLFSIPKLYVTETTGPTAAAKEVYIKKAAKKTLAKTHDGIAVSSDIDIEELRSALASDDGSAPGSGCALASDDGSAPAAPAASVVLAPQATMSPARSAAVGAEKAASKRKAAAPAGEAPAKKSKPQARSS